MPILKAVKNNQKREFEDEVRTVRKRIDEAKEMKTSDEPEILAGALFIVHPQEVVYLFSGTYEKYKQYYAPYLIQHKMLTYTVENNIPKYNFMALTVSLMEVMGFLNSNNPLVVMSKN